MGENVKIDADGYLKLLSKVFENLSEERELALDRYRKADDLMQNIDQFAILGKNAVAFLNLASTSTTSLANLAKEIKSIVYKDDEGGRDINFNITDDFKNKVSLHLEEKEKEKEKDVDKKGNN